MATHGVDCMDEEQLRKLRQIWGKEQLSKTDIKAGIAYGRDYAREMLFAICLYTLGAAIGNLFFPHMFRVLMTIFITYSAVHMFAFGLHLPRLWCRLWSVFLSVAGYLISVHIQTGTTARCIAFTICFSLYAIHAPQGAKCQKVPRGQHLQLKIAGLIIMTTLFLTSLSLTENYMQNAILAGMAMVTINVLPVTYRLFGERTIKSI